VTQKRRRRSAEDELENEKNPPWIRACDFSFISFSFPFLWQHKSLKTNTRDLDASLEQALDHPSLFRFSIFLFFQSFPFPLFNLFDSFLLLFLLPASPFPFLSSLAHSPF